MKNFVLVSIACTLIIFGCSSAKDTNKELVNKVSVKETIIPTILISIDGFANHYLQTYQPKNILKLAEGGVKAKSLIPVFPSKTFPNHISIVTGNYPATHGVIHNKFYNRDLDKQYKLGLGKEDPNWLRSSTLWSIAEQNNIKTGIYFWPESEANISKNKPTYVKPYKHNTPNKKRFNEMINWLTLPEDKRPSLVLGYFSTIDTAGHDFGIGSQEVKQAITDLDLLLGEFLDDIANKVNYDVNIILVSDHGMTDISQNTIQYSYLFEGIDGVKDIRVINGQTQLFVYLPEDDATKEKALVNTIKSKLSTEDKQQVSVYDFENFPKAWHFNTRSSVMPNLVLEVLPPYVFGKPRGKAGATHGYDPKMTSELNAIFIANGPSFKKGIEIEAFENIHVFPMMLSLLGMEVPEGTDADQNVLLPILEH